MSDKILLPFVGNGGTSCFFLQCSELDVAAAFSAHSAVKLFTAPAYFKPTGIFFSARPFFFWISGDIIFQPLEIISFVHILKQTLSAQLIHYFISKETTESLGIVITEPLFETLKPEYSLIVTLSGFPKSLRAFALSEVII